MGVRRSPPLEKGRKTAIFEPTEFFSAVRPPVRGVLREKQNKMMGSSKKTPNNYLKQSAKATDVLKGPCKHNRLYLRVRGRMYLAFIYIPGVSDIQRQDERFPLGMWLT